MLLLSLVACSLDPSARPWPVLPDSPGLPDADPRFEPIELPGRSGPPARSWRASEPRPISQSTTPDPRFPIDTHDPLGGRFAELDGTFVQSLGQDLVERVAELPEERRALGVSGLTLSELAPLCEGPQIQTSFDEEGVPWEARIRLNPFQYFPGELAPDLHAISAPCVAALDAQPLSEVLADGVCDDDAAHVFWPGSRCRDCLESGDGFTACLVADACVEEAPVRYPMALGNAYGPEDYGVVSTIAPACAPDFVAPVKLLYRLDDARPVELAAYDFERWVAVCWQTWSSGGEELVDSCIVGGASTYGDALGAGVIASVETLRPVGETRQLHHNRLAYSPVVRADGIELRTKWLTWDTLAGVATPGALSGFGYGLDPYSALQGWGFQPYELRPGGTDPLSPDDTFAREFVGGAALKTSTTIAGVQIFPFAANRCAEDAWEAVSETRSRCTRLELDNPDAYEPGAVLTDAASFAVGSGSRDAVLTLPMTTLASTGLPDRTLPGGWIVDVKGSTTLANPDWDGCAWPQQFEPDLTVYDRRPGELGEVSPLIGQTYRFGREPAGRDEVRIALNTTTRREFCPLFE